MAGKFEIFTGENGQTPTPQTMDVSNARMLKTDEHFSASRQPTAKSLVTVRCMSLRRAAKMAWRLWWRMHPMPRSRIRRP